MQVLRNACWLCLQQDGIYKCTGDAKGVAYTKVSIDNWSKILDLVKVNDNKAIVVYPDKIYSLNLTDYTWEGLKSADWSGERASVQYGGDIYCLGEFEHLWRINGDTGEHEKVIDYSRSHDITGMIRLGDVALCFKTSGLWSLDLINGQFANLSDENWSGTRAVIEYNGHAYVFYNDTIYKVDPQGKYDKINEENWSNVCKNQAVNFENHCFVHCIKNIYYVNLDTGKKETVDTNSRDKIVGLIPLLYKTEIQKVGPPVPVIPKESTKAELRKVWKDQFDKNEAALKAAQTPQERAEQRKIQAQHLKRTPKRFWWVKEKWLRRNVWVSKKEGSAKEKHYLKKMKGRHGEKLNKAWSAKWSGMKAKMALITEKPDDDHQDTEKNLDDQIQIMPKLRRHKAVMNMQDMIEDEEDEDRKTKLAAWLKKLLEGTGKSQSDNDISDSSDETDTETTDAYSEGDEQNKEDCETWKTTFDANDEALNAATTAEEKSAVKRNKRNTQRMPQITILF